MWAVFGFSSNDCFDFILAVPGTQCLEPDKAFLPCAFNGSVFAAFDFIALLFQFLQNMKSKKKTKVPAYAFGRRLHCTAGRGCFPLVGK